MDDVCRLSPTRVHRTRPRVARIWYGPWRVRWTSRLTVLLVLGLGISIPLVIFGSTLMIRLMERFPIVVTFGAALIGWVGGETIISDNVLAPLVQEAHWLHYAGPALGAAFVLGVGTLLGRRGAAEDGHAMPADGDKR